MSNTPSSPGTRLPSPPPFPEIQIPPKSPSLGALSDTTEVMDPVAVEANARRRIHPGTKAEDMAAGPPLVPLEEVREHPLNQEAFELN